MSQAKRRKGIAKDSPDSQLRFKPAGKTLNDFHRAKEFVRILIGPLGSSKTTSTIVEILKCMHEQTPDANNERRSRWCIIRNTFPDLNSSTIPDWRAVVEGMGLGEISMGSPPMWKAVYRRMDGSIVKAEVMFRSFDGPQDQRKARGMQLTGVWFNEMAELNKANVDLLMSRVKRYPSRQELPNGKFHILGDSNAPDRDHWLATLALDNTPKNWWFGIQPPAVIKVGGSWEVNPRAENLDNLAEGYYEDQLGGKQESWIRKNLENKFVYHEDGRAVHPTFNEQLHVVEKLKPTPGIPLNVGIDFGRTPAATIAQKQMNGQWFVLRELCTVNMGADRFGRLLKDLLNAEFDGYRISEATGDPSGNAMSQTRDETPFDLLAISGIEAVPAYTNDFDIRVAALDANLSSLIEGQPALLIDRSCTTLCRGLAGQYQYRRVQVTGQERFTDKPDKGPTSHVCESLHYLLLGAGEGDKLFEIGGEDSFTDDDWKMPASYFE